MMGGAGTTHFLIDNGVFPCPSGQRPCPGSLSGCVETRTDVATRGACGKQRPTGQRCVGGVCVVGWPACDPTKELIACGDTCTNLQSDSNYCGSCGHRLTRIRP
jgi:hypothetical protein